ncbi:Hypothetical predicted protein [Pelobates cultripes]|nr:Hypothetical predicted protein [Pelobates cultripes]
MDGYLHKPQTLSHEIQGPNAADRSDRDRPTLADISANLKALATAMVTKTDLQTLSETIHEAICTEVATLKTELVSQGNCIQVLD